ncbi:ABC transporter ATP-binding protein [Desulfobaculum sp.]
MSHVAVRVEGLAKRYRLGVVNTGWLFRDIQSWWARRTGRDDPAAVVHESGLERAAPRSGHIWALRGVDLDVGKGEVLGIVGRNGAGKSTLLKILTRVTLPTQGHVKLRGRVASMLEVGTGFHPELTGRENIFLNGAILGMRRAEIAAKFSEIVDFSGVGRFVDTPVKRYSSGMYVRLAFAVAAHLESDIMLVDEVLAVGDAAFQKRCLGKMGDVAGQGRTVLFVSHNMAAVRSLCSRTIVLEDGRVAFDGDTASAVDHYLGVRGDVRAELGMQELTQRAVPYAPDGEEVLRPVQLRLEDAGGAPRTRFHSDEEVCLRVAYDVLSPAAEFRIVVMLTNDEGDPIVTADSADGLAPDEDFSLAPGRWESVARFPAELFGAQRFWVNVTVQAPGRHHVALQRALRFDVVFAGFNPRNVSSASRKGYIRPRVAWTRRRCAAVEEGA